MRNRGRKKGATPMRCQDTSRKDLPISNQLAHRGKLATRERKAIQALICKGRFLKISGVSIFFNQQRHQSCLESYWLMEFSKLATNSWGIKWCCTRVPGRYLDLGRQLWSTIASTTGLKWREATSKSLRILRCAGRGGYAFLSKNSCLLT